MILSNSIKRILIEHYKKYPEMEEVDYIKLIYQNVFGCGHHLVADKSKQFLIAEYNQFPHEYKENMYEDIGNGYCRIDLKHTNLSVDEIFDKLIESSKNDKGSKKEFNSKINILKRLARRHRLPLSIEKINMELDQLSGLPRHSEKYHKLYSPHYRVIKKKLINFK